MRSLPTTRGFRRLCLLLLVVTCLCVPGGAQAHTGHGAVAATEQVQVGPYQVQVEFSEWPVTAERAVQIILIPEDGIEGFIGGIRFTPEGHSEHGADAYPYPAIPDALTINHPGLPYDGVWQLEVVLNGPKGVGSGRLQPMTVGPAPSFPKWLGWLMAATPMLVYFGYLGWADHRFRRARTADGGAWA